MYISIVITQGVIPLGLLLWQAGVTPRNQLSWLLKTLLVAAALGAVTLAGLWYVLLPWWTPYGYWLAWGAIAMLTYGPAQKLPRWPKRNFWAIALVFVYGILTGFLSVQIFQAAMGYVPPSADLVSLSFPLKDGTYQVANGGSQQLISSHMMTLTEERFRSYRGQSYAVDIVKLNRLGTRSPGLLPKAVERYEIYGEPIYSPCSGRVVAAFNDAPDAVPPQPDRDHMSGNFVLLRCEAADVLLAHLKPGSAKVKVGDAIATGQPLGAVGNSGNTNEPHLHIHAQRPGSEATPFDGDPLPVVFDGRYLVRNARITQ
ncbi:MAG: peptidoglycan DD-metalloendopeptidase family protein [Phormidesmis sp. RL_2_1]|nr:peptidoglycan DD-metalloendopeptidase family protein [Phormidesmis sp. RL_2_1]